MAVFVSGRSIEEDRPARVHRRAQRLEELVADDEVGERFLESLAVHSYPEDGLALDHLAVVVHRHRNRTDVTAQAHIFARAAAALGRHAVAARGNLVAARREHLDAFEVLPLLEQIARQLHRQAEPLGRLAAREGVEHEHRLEHVGHQEVPADAEVLNRPWLFEGERVVGALGFFFGSLPVGSHLGGCGGRRGLPRRRRLGLLRLCGRGFFLEKAGLGLRGLLRRGALRAHADARLRGRSLLRWRDFGLFFGFLIVLEPVEYAHCRTPLKIRPDFRRLGVHLQKMIVLFPFSQKNIPAEEEVIGGYLGPFLADPVVVDINASPGEVFPGHGSGLG
jgi:hypothetical protein